MTIEQTRLSLMGKSTRAIHGGNPEPPRYGEICVPVYQTSTFSFPDAAEGAARFSGAKRGYIYSRVGNPTVYALEEKIAALENGFAAMGASTGMAAVTTALLAVLGQNTHVVATDSIYSASHAVLSTELPRFGVRTTFVDTTDAGAIERAMRADTKLVYIETPSNPTIQLTDIRLAAEIAHGSGALLAVDNTFAGPFLQRPIDLGADIVIHSLTKSINGHSDVLGGMIVTRDEELRDKIRHLQSILGSVMDPHQAQCC